MRIERPHTIVRHHTRQAIYDLSISPLVLFICILIYLQITKSNHGPNITVMEIAANNCYLSDCFRDHIIFYSEAPLDEK